MGMGDLDEAIREHLELKRQHGATEEEVATKEREARKSGALPSQPGEQLDVPVDAARTEPAETETREEPSMSPPEVPPPADELEPDEVLPEEALEFEVPPTEEPSHSAGPAPDWSPADLPEDPESESEDVLEETPEFLEDMPEQDRLWFEQRPPKDFDFDD
jgi:hypothetical protein